MLQSMRQNLKSLQIFLWIVIAAFIGTIFLVWGQGGRKGSSGGQNAVAWVNGTPISYTSFENGYRNIYGFYKQLYGDNLSRDVLESLQLEQVALNQLTQRMLLLEEAQRHNLQISDDELITAIQEMPQFQRNNQFDATLYKNTLDRARITLQEFEQQTMESLLVGKVEHLIKQTVRLGDQEVLNDYRLQHEQIAVEGFLVKAEDFQEQAEVNEEAVQAYYDTHKERFTTPPRVKIQYIHFDPQQLKAEVTPTEEDIQQYYDAHEKEFNKGKEVSARHILFRLPQDADDEAVAQVKTKAEEVLQQLKDGGDFIELAKAHSEDPGSAQSGGDLGFFPKGRMIPEFEDAAFALAPGEISDLVKTQYGFHIIKVEEMREEKDPYGKAKPEIIERLQLAQAKNIAAERSEISYEDLLDTDNLKEVARKDQLEVQVSDFFAQGEPIDDKTGALQQIQEIAFTLNADEKYSQPIETPAGYYLVEFLELKEPYVPELTEIQEQVSSAVRREKASDLAKIEAENIETALAEGAAWEKIPEEYTAKAIAPQPFSRRQSYISEVGGNADEFIKVAFSLQDEEYSSVLDLSGNYGIIRVKERKAIEQSAFENEKKAHRDNLLRQKQDAVFREVIEELRQKADIKVSEQFFS